MSKFNVKHSKFVEIALELGLKTLDNANWTKITCNGRAVYVAKPKSENVRAITIAGFEYPSELVVPPPAHNGRVTGMVDFDREGNTEESVLACFRGALETMVALPAPVEKEKPASSPAVTKGKRLAAIREKAVKKGLGKKDKEPVTVEQAMAAAEAEENASSSTEQVQA